MARANDITLKLRTDPRLLCAVRALVRQYFSDARFEEARVDELVLAVDEACTNCIRHAYGGRTDRSMTLRLDAADGWIEVCVTDQGAPAPPEAVRRKRPRAPNPDKLEPHGLGVQLMYRVFDEVAFAQGKGKGNTITMRVKQPRAK